MTKLEVELDKLIAARDILRDVITKSRYMAYAIDERGCRLEEMNQRLPALEASIKIIARKCEINKFRVDHAVAPAAAVLSVYNVVNQLQKSLLLADPHDSSALIPYISKVKRLEEALRFLTQNCKLAVLWLEDVVVLLENNALLSQYDDHCFYSNHVRKSLKILRNLEAMEERSHLDGGLLNAAFTKLEKEFRHLSVQNTYPLEQRTSYTDSTTVSLLAYPLPVVEKMQLILERLAANNRLDRCVSIYIEVRTFNFQRTLQALDLDYLETTLISEYDSVQSIESSIEKWSGDLEFAVKHLLELEYRASNVVFNKVVGLDVSKECFVKTAVRCELLQGFIKFANTITKGKKEAIKLLKLLDIFASLNKLRVDFNRFFGGQTCVEIQTQMRDLITKVINEACDIFWELPTQVESQRQSTPPADGGIPRLLSFVVDYSNELLSEYYRPILIQILEIHWSWNNNHTCKEDLEKQRQQFLLNSEEVHYKKIIKALELNIQAWGRTYKDSTLSYIFLMNSHWYLCNNLKGTEIGDVMGDSWLRGQEKCVEHYASVFVRESWGKLAPLLTDQEEGLQVLLSGGGTAVSRDSMKRRIKAFTEAFDGMYRKQCHWVVPDTGLRWKLCQLLVRTVVPAYSNFILSCISNLEVEAAEKDRIISPTLAGKRCVNNSKESLENMLCSLFQPKLVRKHGTSAKSRHLISKIKNVVSNHFVSTSPAAA